MKKALLVGILLVLASVYLGVLNPQAAKAQGVIWGYATYPPPWHWIKYDNVRVLNLDFSPTPYWDNICGAEPHQYWIVNGLPSNVYRLRVKAYDCNKTTMYGPFYYEEDSMLQYDVTTCIDWTPDGGGPE